MIFFLVFLVLPRPAVEAILLGCVPVIVAEHDAPALQYFEPFVLDWNSFAVKVSKSDIPNLASILAWDDATGHRALRLERMSALWPRFLWAHNMPAWVKRKMGNQPDAFQSTMQALRQARPPSASICLSFVCDGLRGSLCGSIHSFGCGCGGGGYVCCLSVRVIGYWCG